MIIIVDSFFIKRTSLARLPKDTTKTMRGRRGSRYNMLAVDWEMLTMDRYGHLFESDNHKAAMDRIASEFME